jgi:hypothetical protein
MQVSRKYRALLPLMGSALIAALTCWAPVEAMPDNQAFSSAASVVVQLQCARPSMTLLSDYSQTTDPEHLLGLTGQYLARATFNDYDVTSDPGGVTGIVEVFASTRDMLSRQQTMVKPDGESDAVVGPVLVRLFGLKDRATFDAYQAALNVIVLT